MSSCPVCHVELRVQAAGDLVCDVCGMRLRGRGGGAAAATLHAPAPRGPDQARSAGARLRQEALAQARQGRTHAALATLRRAVETLQAAQAAEPQEPSLRADLADALLELGRLELVDGDAATGPDTLGAAVDLLRERLARSEDDLAARQGLATALGLLGRVRLAAGALPEARRALEEAVELHRALAPGPGADPEERAHLALAGVLSDLARTGHREGRLAAAQALAEEALAILREATRLLPERPDLLSRLGAELEERIALARSAARPDEVAAALREAVAARRRLAALDPGRRDAGVGLAAALLELGLHELAADRHPEARRCLDEARSLRLQALAASGHAPEARADVAEVLALMVVAGRAGPRPAPAAEVEGLQRLIPAHWPGPAAAPLQEIVRQLAERARARGRAAVAAALDRLAPAPP